MKSVSICLFAGLFQLSSFAMATEVTLQADRSVVKEAVGKLSVSGSFVRGATNSYSSDDTVKEAHPVDKVELTNENGKFTVSVSLLPEQPALYNNLALESIRVDFSGKRSTGELFDASISLQPLSFSEGTFFAALRYPFNTVVDYKTKIDSDGIPQIVSRNSVAYNGFSISMNAGGCNKSLTDMKINKLYFISANSHLELDMSFKGQCDGSSDYEGSLSVSSK